MDQFSNELQSIKELLKRSNHGMSITEIALALKKNNHSVGRYLDNLLVSGQVEMRTYGKAKVFSLSTRVPLDTMLGFADDLIIVLDQDNRIVRINNQFLDFFNKSRHDLIGKSIQYVTFPESWANMFFERIQISSSSGVFDEEIQIPKDEGHIFRQKLIPTVFEDGKKGMTILLENITDKKKSDTALRTSEERFRLMAENIQDGLIIREHEKITYINRRAEEIFGYTREELATLSPHDLADPEDRDRIRKIISDASTSRIIPSGITFWIQRKDGTRRFISNRITHIRHATDITVYIVITDMTEWKHAQNALENQLSFLQHMINTFPNPLFYIDITGRYLGCNSAFCRIMGKTFEEIAGKTNAELLDPKQAELMSKYDKDLINQTKVLNYSGVIQNFKGVTYEVNIQKSSLVTTNGEHAGVVGLILSMNMIE